MVTGNFLTQLDSKLVLVGNLDGNFELTIQSTGVSLTPDLAGQQGQKGFTINTRENIFQIKQRHRVNNFTIRIFWWSPREMPSSRHMSQ